MQLVNCTPHVVDILSEDEQFVLISIPPSGMTARVAVAYERDSSLNVHGVSVPIVHRRLGEVVDLPEPVRAVRFIVSQVLANELADSRTDLLFPADLIRDGTGRVIGCKALARP